MANFTVVYDACVLYPASIRDLAVELARTGLLRAKWVFIPFVLATNNLTVL